MTKRPSVCSYLQESVLEIERPGFLASSSDQDLASTGTFCDALKSACPFDNPSTCGIFVDVGLPDTTHQNRAESPLYGELYSR